MSRELFSDSSAGLPPAVSIIGVPGSLFFDSVLFEQEIEKTIHERTGIIIAGRRK